MDKNKIIESFTEACEKTLLIILSIIAIMLIPYAAFWSLKILFGITIPFSIKSVIAFWILISILNIVSIKTSD